MDLSVWMWDQGCRNFISLSVCWSGTITLAVIKIPTNSASEAEGMNTLIIFSRDRTWPLLQGIGSLYEHKMCDPAWLRVQVSLRYAASEFAANIILMDLYVMPSLG